MATNHVVEEGEVGREGNLSLHFPDVLAVSGRHGLFGTDEKALQVGNFRKSGTHARAKQWCLTFCRTEDQRETHDLQVIHRCYAYLG